MQDFLLFCIEHTERIMLKDHLNNKLVRSRKLFKSQDVLIELKIFHKKNVHPLREIFELLGNKLQAH